MHLAIRHADTLNLLACITGSHLHKMSMKTSLCCASFAVLVLCASARLVVVQGEDDELQVSVESKTYYVLPSTQGDVLESVEYVSSPSHRTWGSLLTPVRNPLTWFMQQLQELDQQLSAASSSAFSTRDEAPSLRAVGCNRFRQAMKDYQAANKLVSQIVEQSQAEEEEGYDEYYSDEYMLEDQEALKLMALMDDKYMTVYSDDDEGAVLLSEAEGTDAAAADSAPDGEDAAAAASDADSVMSTEDAQDARERDQFIADLVNTGNAIDSMINAQLGGANADMWRQRAQPDGSNIEVLVGSMAGDGHLRTTRYTVGRDGVQSRDSQASSLSDADPGQQLLPQSEEPESDDDNLEQAVSVADLMMDQVRAAYLRGQLEAAHARAQAASLAAALNDGTAAAVVDEDGDDVFAFGGARAAPQRSSVLDPLAALGHLLDSLLLGGAPVQPSNSLAAAAAERKEVEAAVREQLRRDAAVSEEEAQEEEAEAQVSRGGARGTGWLLTGGNTLTASILRDQSQQRDESQQVSQATAAWEVEEGEVVPAQPASLSLLRLDSFDWYLTDPTNRRIVFTIGVVSTCIAVVCKFMIWYAQQDATRGESGDVMVPVTFEHEGRLAQGFVLLPRGMAHNMGSGQVLASMGNSKDGSSTVPCAKAGCEIVAEKEEAQRVWGAKQMHAEQAAHTQQQEQQGASTVVIAAEHVEPSSPAHR